MDKKSLSVQEASAHHQLSAGNAPLLLSGYKQTEVGVIPENWEAFPLGALADVIMGQSPSGTTYNKSGDGIALINGPTEFTKVYPVKVQWTTEPTKTCQKDDLLICVRGSSTGRMNVSNDEYCIGRGVAAIRANPKSDTVYLTHQIHLGIERLLAFSAGSTFANVDGKSIRSILIPLPPTKAEQEAIAEALSDVDALIESLEQLIAKKRHFKQGAMQELLTGKKRLPGFSEEWKEKPISSFSAFITKGATPTTYGFSWKNDGVLFLRSECVSADGLDLTQSMFISETAHVALIRGEIRAGDILTITGNVGRVVHLGVDFGIANINQHIARIRVNEPDVSSYFVFHWLSQLSVRVYYALITTGQAYPQISLKQVRETQVPLPSFSEQTAIAAILSDMDAEIAALEEKLAKTRAIKQGMMHNLLTGKVRLVDPAIVKVEQHALLDIDSIPFAPKPDKSHNWAFNEAVVIAVLADLFVGKPEFPLGRKRYTKLSYLMHRKAEQEVQGYLKKAAGPYNPKTKYSGPEKIAQENGYMRQHENGKYKGFIAGEKIEQAKAYFIKWYGSEIIAWLEQFRYRSNDDLELLATVDMAMQELLKQGKAADVGTVRALIASEPEWLPKLERAVFSDSGIAAAIEECQAFFTR